MDRLVSDAAKLVEKQKNHETVLEELTAKFDAVKTRQNKVEQLAGLRDTALANHDRAIEISKTRADLVKRATLASEDVDKHLSTIESTLPARTQAETLRINAEKAVEGAKERVRDAEAAHRRAVGDRDYRRQQIELAQLTERKDRVLGALERRSEAESILEASHIDDSLFNRIEEAHLELVKAEAAATSAAATIDAEALTDLDIQIDETPVDLKAGAHHELQVSGTMRIVVPGTIELLIKTSAEAKVLADRRREAELSFQSLCEKAHEPDLAGARQALNARHDAERVLSDAETSIRQDLRDLTSEDLVQKVERLTSRVGDV